MHQFVQTFPMPEVLEGIGILRNKQLPAKKSEFGRDADAVLSFGLKTMLGNPEDFDGETTMSGLSDECHAHACEFYNELRAFNGESTIGTLAKDRPILRMIIEYLLANWQKFLPQPTA